MAEGMFQEGKPDAPDAETLKQYAEDNDILVAKHILLLTKDMTTQEALSEEEIAEKKQGQERWLAELQAITDSAQLEEKFDELMQANSEDSGLESNPDGYASPPGTWWRSLRTPPGPWSRPDQRHCGELLWLPYHSPAGPLHLRSCPPAVEQRGDRNPAGAMGGRG